MTEPGPGDRAAAATLTPLTVQRPPAHRPLGCCLRKPFAPCPGSCRGQSPAQSEALSLPLSGGAAVTPPRDAGAAVSPLTGGPAGSARRPARGSWRRWVLVLPPPSPYPTPAPSRGGARPAPLGGGRQRRLPGLGPARPWAGAAPCLSSSRGSPAGTCPAVGAPSGVRGLAVGAAGAGAPAAARGCLCGGSPPCCGVVARGGERGAGGGERSVALKTKEEPLKLARRWVWRRRVWVPAACWVLGVSDSLVSSAGVTCQAVASSSGSAASVTCLSRQVRFLFHVAGQVQGLPRCEPWDQWRSLSGQWVRVSRQSLPGGWASSGLSEVVLCV